MSMVGVTPDRLWWVSQPTVSELSSEFNGWPNQVGASKLHRLLACGALSADLAE